VEVNLNVNVDESPTFTEDKTFPCPVNFTVNVVEKSPLSLVLFKGVIAIFIGF
jgi:hypothetical protein